MWRRVVLVWTDVSEKCIAVIFYPEDGGDTFLRNVGSHKNYPAPHPRRRLLHRHRRENLNSYNLKSFFKKNGKYKFRLDTLGNLYESMPRRIAGVLKVKRRRTPYCYV
jgi:predicted RNA binding protein YcfA (HicA-like mRNA interferase family)